MYTYGWFMLIYGRNQHTIVKTIFLQLKFKKRREKTLGILNLLNRWERCNKKKKTGVFLFHSEKGMSSILELQYNQRNYLLTTALESKHGDFS